MGSSMRAQCSTMYTQKYPNNIFGVILDSPFQKLENAINRIAKKQMSLSDFIIKPILYAIKNKASEQVSQDLFGIDYLQIFKKFPLGLPVLLIYSLSDKIVPPQQVQKIYAKFFKLMIKIVHKKYSIQVFLELQVPEKALKDKFVSQQLLQQWKDKRQYNEYHSKRGWLISQK